MSLKVDLLISSTDYSFGLLEKENNACGAGWLSSKFSALRPDGRRFEFHSSSHVRAMAKFALTVACGALVC